MGWPLSPWVTRARVWPARPCEAGDVAPFGEQLVQRQTVALFRSTDLEVIRMVLPQGGGLPPHKVPGEVTIQYLAGLLEVQVGGRPTRLAAQQLLFVPGGETHALTAPEASSALVTIALPR